MLDFSKKLDIDDCVILRADMAGKELARLVQLSASEEAEEAEEASEEAINVAGESFAKAYVAACMAIRSKQKRIDAAHTDEEISARPKLIRSISSHT